MTFDLDLWPTDLTIDRDHLLTKDYLPTNFEASWAKRSGVISCTRLRANDIPTDIPTYRPTDMCNAICPSFFEGGQNKYINLKNKRPKGSQAWTWVPYLEMEHTLIIIDTKYTYLKEDVKYLSSVKFCWKSIQQLQGRMWKCLSQSEARVTILVFRSAKKITNLLEDIKILLPVKFPWILLSGCREVKNVSANQRPGRPSWFCDWPE